MKHFENIVIGKSLVPWWELCCTQNPTNNEIMTEHDNSSDFNKADSVIRILFTEPDYVYHKDSKKLWKLNAKDKRLLLSVLKMESVHYKGYTNWQVAM